MHARCVCGEGQMEFSSRLPNKHDDEGRAKVKLYVKRKLRSNVAGSASRRTPFREF